MKKITLILFLILASITSWQTSAQITCPADMTVNNDPGVCGATVTYSDPTVSPGIPPQTIPGFTTIGYNQGSMFYISNSDFTAPNAYSDAVARGGKCCYHK